MVGIHVVAPLRHAIVPWCDLCREDDGGVFLAQRDKHQRLSCIGRGLAADGDGACLGGLNLQESAVRRQVAEGCFFREFGDERLGGTIGRWHLRGQQASVACMPCPSDTSIVGRAQRHFNAVEGDGRPHVAAIVGRGVPFRLRIASEVHDVGSHVSTTCQ